jgi:NAD(P)-dependent dehydrogenase (short-subunit alcohol dehydrogenase family)
MTGRRTVRVANVTGAARGQGRAPAVRMLREGTHALRVNSVHPGPASDGPRYLTAAAIPMDQGSTQY